MIFKRAIWYPIAVVLSVANVAAVWFAARPAEPWHATTHAALAVAFGLWAQRLHRSFDRSQFPSQLEALEAFDALDAEVSTLRRDLGEAQERLDFAERLLAQRPEARRVDPQP